MLRVQYSTSSGYTTEHDEPGPIPEPPVDHPVPTQESPRRMTTTATASPRTVKVTPRLVSDLVAIVGAENVLHQPRRAAGLRVRRLRRSRRTCPTSSSSRPSTEQVVEVVKLCNRHDVPFVPRGAGTSLAGGTLAVGGGVMICLTRMKRILEINTRDRYAIVEPGVVNVWLTRALAGTGFHYAPDPSSQGACTIGGNVATNSGGPHTLKYGVTVNHVLGVELVLPDGSVVETGGVTEDNPGYDLTGLIVGNEGTFGIVTKVIVDLTRDPEAGRTLARRLRHGRRRRPRPSAASSPPGSSRPRSRCSTT